MDFEIPILMMVYTERNVSIKIWKKKNVFAPLPREEYAYAENGKRRETRWILSYKKIYAYIIITIRVNGGGGGGAVETFRTESCPRDDPAPVSAR